MTITKIVKFRETKHTITTSSHIVTNVGNLKQAILVIIYSKQQKQSSPPISLLKKKTLQNTCQSTPTCLNCNSFNHSTCFLYQKIITL